MRLLLVDGQPGLSCIGAWALAPAPVPAPVSALSWLIPGPGRRSGAQPNPPPSFQLLLMEEPGQAHVGGMSPPIWDFYFKFSQLARTSGQPMKSRTVLAKPGYMVTLGRSSAWLAALKWMLAVLSFCFYQNSKNGKYEVQIWVQHYYHSEKRLSRVLCCLHAVTTPA